MIGKAATVMRKAATEAKESYNGHPKKLQSAIEKASTGDGRVDHGASGDAEGAARWCMVLLERPCGVLLLRRLGATTSDDSYDTQCSKL